MWRGSLLPLGCAAVANPCSSVSQENSDCRFGGASHPSGSKLPRHRGSVERDRPTALRAPRVFA
ncbi:hypothetical protein FCH79_14695 [Pseudomonas koreensis]|nr:hypothetical protein [Pseudomonas koreensis]